MIDFTTLQGLTIPEGVVTQIAKDGVVLWKLETSKPVILEVEKITSDTYAGETTYTGEEFILLDIYPKTNGTVSVTYGGLTKTITDTSGAESPNAQKVFFGTFNGVSDSVATPTSGALTISGDVYAFSVSSYTQSKSYATYCGCIISIRDWGAVEIITNSAFRYCTGLTNIDIPDGVTAIGDNAFTGCESITNIKIPSNVKIIGNRAFSGCKGLSSVTIENGLQTICAGAFMSCAITDFTIPASVTKIEDFVWSQCENLTRVTVLATTPPTFSPTDGKVLFAGCKITTNGSGTVIVPKGCGAAYKAADGWKDVEYNIVEAS